MLASLLCAGLHHSMTMKWRAFSSQGYACTCASMHACRGVVCVCVCVAVLMIKTCMSCRRLLEKAVHGKKAGSK